MLTIIAILIGVNAIVTTAFGIAVYMLHKQYVEQITREEEDE